MSADHPVSCTILYPAPSCARPGCLVHWCLTRRQSCISPLYLALSLTRTCEQRGWRTRRRIIRRTLPVSASSTAVPMSTCPCLHSPIHERLRLR